MMWRALVLVMLACAAAPRAALADSVVATRTIRAQSVIGPQDITRVDADIPGAVADPDAAIGQETRVAIYAGRPVRPEDLGPPSVIERNQRVPISFRAGGLVIQAEGRALARGGVGDTIRVMNLTSRTTVTGRIGPDGTVLVGTMP